MNNLYVRLAKNNLKNNKSLYVPYMVAGMITVLMFYIMMFINNSAGLELNTVSHILHIARRREHINTERQ